MAQMFKTVGDLVRGLKDDRVNIPFDETHHLSRPVKLIFLAATLVVREKDRNSSNSTPLTEVILYTIANVAFAITDERYRTAGAEITVTIHNITG